MSALFSSPKAPPAVDDEKVDEERRRRMLAERFRQGRAATILTGGAGILNTPATQTSILG